MKDQERVARALESIAKQLSDISYALEQQNKMISEVMMHPEGQPSRIVVGCCGPMEVITF